MARYQLELLTTLNRFEASSGQLTDFDQLLDTLSWMPSKESAQFTIRAMIAKGFIVKAPLQSRRGRNRICYRLIETGKAVLDPRRMASKGAEKEGKRGPEKAEKSVEKTSISGLPEEALKVLEIDLSFRDFEPEISLILA